MTGCTPRAATAPCRWCCRAAMPIAPSQTLSGYLDHTIPHALDLDEIDWLVREYGESAALAAEAGADAIELHCQPRRRAAVVPVAADQPARRRLRRQPRGAPTAAARGVRVDPPARRPADHARPAAVPGRDGSTAATGSRSAPRSCRRSPRTAPSTTSASTSATTGARRAMCRSACTRRASGHGLAGRGQGGYPPARRSTSAAWSTSEVAEAILAAGQADLVGLARALIADPQLVAKTRAGPPHRHPAVHRGQRLHQPALRGGTCRSRCAVNPDAGREFEAPGSGRPAVARARAGDRRRPAGTEVAALRRRAGPSRHAARAEDRLGGQLAIAALARMNRPVRRLDRLAGAAGCATSAVTGRARWSRRASRGRPRDAARRRRGRDRRAAAASRTCPACDLPFVLGAPTCSPARAAPGRGSW